MEWLEAFSHLPGPLKFLGENPSRQRYLAESHRMHVTNPVLERLLSINLQVSAKEKCE